MKLSSEINPSNTSRKTQLKFSNELNSFSKKAVSHKCFNEHSKFSDTLAELLAEIDANNDGVVTSEELIDYLGKVKEWEYDFKDFRE